MADQDKALSILIESLPKLASLDISGTHLAGLEQPETKDRFVTQDFLNYFSAR